jgi:hypothetical protein
MFQLPRDMFAEIDQFAEPSSEGASRHDPADIAPGHPSTCNNSHSVNGGAPTLDEEETISEMLIRDRMIEWLASFLSR